MTLDKFKEVLCTVDYVQQKQLKLISDTVIILVNVITLKKSQ